MKIISYKKQKNNCYKVILEDRQITLYDDIIIKYNLLIKKEISEKDLSIIEKDNNIYKYYYESLNYIKKRLRSKCEIELYLSKNNITKTQINTIIKMLEQNNYINDTIFTKAYIHDKLSFTNYGPYKIKQELLKLHIDENIIKDELIIFNDYIQEDRINKYVNKQVKTNKNKSLYVLKNNLLNNLINLGYERSLINNVLNTIEINEQDIYQQEYNKLYNKLSKKYSDKELEYKIKQKLYQKGFH